MAKLVKSSVKIPKQDRSRASFERVLDAAVELLTEKGYAGFTLGEVSRRSRVSIGSIYCRVNGKDDLFHAVQDYVLSGIDAEVAAMLEPAKWERVEPRKMLFFVVREMGEHLRRNTPILRAFIDREVADPVVMSRGKAAHFRFLAMFHTLLMHHADKFRHPDPDHAITFCFNVAFSSIAKHLDLDTKTPSNDGAQWNQLLDDLGWTLTLFLLSDPAAYATMPSAAASAGLEVVTRGGRQRKVGARS